MNKFEIVLHEFVTSHIDSCNSLYCVSHSLSRSQYKIQLPDFLKGSRKFDHVTPITISLLINLNCIV